MKTAINNNLFQISLTEDECNALKIVLDHADYDLRSISCRSLIPVSAWEILRNLYFGINSAQFHRG